MRALSTSHIIISVTMPIAYPSPSHCQARARYRSELPWQPTIVTKAYVTDDCLRLIISNIVSLTGMRIMAKS